MSKIITLYDFKIESENEFTKIFVYGETKIYLSKAYDEDTDKHFLLALIPHISEVNASDIKYPFPFDTAEERDNYFIDFDMKMANQFMRNLISFIIEQNEKNK
jgi:hypothetical protein